MTPTERLGQALRAWRLDRTEPVAEVKARLRGLITSDFEDADLLNVPKRSFLRMSRPLVRGNEAKVLVYDSADPTPYLATLVRDGDQWCLRSFKFQCHICFGTGIERQELCVSCGATGWGLAAS